MQKCPVVSVVMPVVETSKEFEEALFSLKSQDYKNIEFVIVVDNPDFKPIKKTLKIIANKDKRFKLYSNKKNCGTYMTRKIGTENATGDLICFLDSDDFFCETNTISQMVNCFLVNNCPDVLCASYYELYTEKKLARQLKNQTFSDNFLEEMLLKKEMPFYMWGKLYKRDLLLFVYDFLPLGNIFLLEDLLVNFFVCLYAKSFVTTDFFLFVYRKTSGLTATKTLTYKKFKHLASFDSVFTIIFDFIENNKKTFPVSDKIQIELSKIAFTQLTMLCKAVPTMEEKEKQSAFEYLNQEFGSKLVNKALNTPLNTTCKDSKEN